MKLKPLALLLGLCLLVGCGGQQTPAGMADDLTVLALGQAGEIVTLAGDVTYMELYTSYPGAGDTAAQIAALDPGRPVQGFTLELEGSALEALAAMMLQEGEDAARLESFSPPAVKRMESNILALLPNMVNGSHGTETMMVASVLQTGVTCQKPKDFPGNHCVILVFDGEWATYTSYVEGEEDTLNASTMLLRMSDPWLEAARDGELLAQLQEVFPVPGLVLEEIGSDALAQAAEAAAPAEAEASA